MTTVNAHTRLTAGLHSITHVLPQLIAFTALAIGIATIREAGLGYGILLGLIISMLAVNIIAMGVLHPSKPNQGILWATTLIPVLLLATGILYARA